MSGPDLSAYEGMKCPHRTMPEGQGQPFGPFYIHNWKALVMLQEIGEEHEDGTVDATSPHLACAVCQKKIEDPAEALLVLFNSLKRELAILEQRISLLDEKTKRRIIVP